MRIDFWGVRGSIPTPSSADFVTSRYGGNTTCVSLRIPGQTVIFDAGSGLRTLGLSLARQMPLHATFFFSHVHWDHIQGFPFFIPGFVPGNSFQLYGPAFKREGVTGSILESALVGQQASLNFPIQLKDMAAKFAFADLPAGARVELQGAVSKLVITSGELNHPGGSYGYRVEEHKADGSVATFVYATDTEHFEDLNPSLQTLSTQANVLFYDAQYTEDEYCGRAGMPKKGWGHSTWVKGIKEAKAAGVRHLVLTHHDPLHDDWAVARIENDARREGLKVGLAVSAAYEGMVLEV
jgi:phosphoribosyl 1,2-cyclic phosphodiesterase